MFYCPHALADGNQRIQIREKTLEFSSTVLSTSAYPPSPSQTSKGKKIFVQHLMLSSTQYSSLITHYLEWAGTSVCHPHVYPQLERAMGIIGSVAVHCLHSPASEHHYTHFPSHEGQEAELADSTTFALNQSATCNCHD